MNLNEHNHFTLRITQVFTQLLTEPNKLYRFLNIFSPSNFHSKRKINMGMKFI